MHIGVHTHIQHTKAPKGIWELTFRKSCDSFPEFAPFWSHIQKQWQSITLRVTRAMILLSNSLSFWASLPIR